MADPKEEAFNVLVDALNDPKQAGRHAQIRAVLAKHGRSTDTAFVDETGEGIGGMSRLELDDQGNTRDVPARAGHVEGATVQTLRPTPAAIEADPNRPDDLQDLAPGGRLNKQLANQMMPPKPKAKPPEVRPGYFHSMGREYPDTDEFVPRMARGINRLRAPVEKAAMVGNRFVDVGTGGLYSRALSGYSSALGTQVGPSMEDFERFRTENPTTDNITTFAANVNPKGIAGKVAGKVNTIADPLMAAVKRRLTKDAPGRAASAATTLLGGAASSGAGNAATSGLEAAVEGASPGEIGDRMIQGGKGGAMFGAGMRALVGTAKAGASALRNRKSSSGEDLRVLDEHGLEPSPIPGRPVVRKDQSLLSQVPGREPPPLVNRATPATRASAGRVAADELVADQTAMSKANNQRFGELKGEVYAKEGKNKAPFMHIVKEIDRRLAKEDLADDTRSALEKVRAKFDRYMPKPAPPPAPPAPAAAAPAAPPLPPEIAAMEDMMAKAKSPQVRADLQKAIAEAKGNMPTLMAPPPAAPPPPPPAPKPPKKFTAASLDKIRDYTDTKVRKGEVQKGDVDFMQLSELMRNTLSKKDVGPGIAALNKAYSGTKKSFGKRQALLGMKKAQRGEGEDVAQAVARRITERGEETKTAGVRTGAEGHDLDRVIAMGRPRTLPGTKLPDAPDYKGLIDAPRLQLAQENNQAVTSKVFSGAGPAQTTGPGLLARYASYIPNRLVYPLSRRLGEKQVGSGFGLDELIRAVRQRGDKKKQGAEMRKESE